MNATQTIAHARAPAVRVPRRARRLQRRGLQARAADAANRYGAAMPYGPARKLLSAHPRMAEDLLRGFVARRWSHALGFRTLELRPAASVGDDLRRREGDLLWRVRLGGTWLYVRLEFQSTVDPTGGAAAEPHGAAVPGPAPRGGGRSGRAAPSGVGVDGHFRIPISREPASDSESHRLARTQSRDPAPRPQGPAPGPPRGSAFAASPANTAVRIPTPFPGETTPRRSRPRCFDASGGA